MKGKIKRLFFSFESLEGGTVLSGEPAGTADGEPFLQAPHPTPFINSR